MYKHIKPLLTLNVHYNPLGYNACNAIMGSITLTRNGNAHYFNTPLFKIKLLTFTTSFIILSRSCFTNLYGRYKVKWESI
jgi:hypothetical protein